MAWHHHRDRVAAVRPAHGAAGARAADAPRDLGVRRRLAVRDRAQLLPYAPLEGRAGRRLELEGEGGPLAREVLLELGGGRHERGTGMRGDGRWRAEADPDERAIVGLERER